MLFFYCGVFKTKVLPICEALASLNIRKVNNEPLNEPCLPPVIRSPNRPGRRTNVLNSLKSVLNAISRKRWAKHFRNPANLALGASNYHEVIKRPMDLGIIRKRMRNNYYWQSDEAIEDFTLIFENCLLFNKEGTALHQAGQEMKSYFYKRLSMIDLTYEVEVEAKEKPKPDKRKARKGRKGRKDTGADPHSPQPKKFCAGVTSLTPTSLPDTLLNPLSRMLIG